MNLKQKSRTTYSFPISVGIMLIAIFSIVFPGCEKDDEIAQIDEVFDYEQLGVEHNRGLDYVFEYLKKEGNDKDSNLKSSKNQFLLAKEATEKYMNQKSIYKGYNYAFSSNFPDLTSSLHSNSLKSAAVPLEDIILSELQTEDAVSIFKEITSTLFERQLNFAGILNNLSKIEKKIDQDSSDRDKIILKSICVVARHSMNYWHKNYDKWIIEFSGANKITGTKVRLKSTATEGDIDDINWSAVAASDALAAGVGATHLVISGTGQLIAATGPVGWLGLGLIVTGYAIEGSAGALLIDIWY
jgi:hypothetical protein